LNIQVFRDPSDLFRIFVDEENFLVLFGELLGYMIADFARSDNDDLQMKIPLFGLTRWRSPKAIRSEFNLNFLLEKDKKVNLQGYLGLLNV
jgi:hypothetical protein